MSKNEIQFPPSGKRRNDALVDVWSVVHFAVAAGLAVFIGPPLALLVTLLWEPVEILVLSPLLGKFGIDFGHESLQNSLSDIVFNVLGILFAIYALGA
ncbi:MAG: hypothetical protein U5L95_04750 [Candidatus Saccharibacteria bacterium]|nr:hypothetical protein [Candidatus Saccharibacteria bacterium]